MSIRNLFLKARSGDFVQMKRRISGGTYSMIVYSVSATGLTVIETNTDNRNGIYCNT